MPKATPPQETSEVAGAVAPVETKSTAVITKEMADMMQDDGTSLSMDFERADVAQSFLKIVQALSPEIDESEAAYIEGLKQGDLFNSGTGLFKRGATGLLVAPVHYQRGYTEWAPRSSNQSLVNDYGPNRPAVIDTIEPVKGQWPLPNGNTIMESAVYVVLIIDSDTGDFESAVLNLSGTQYKKARRWNRMIQNARAKHPVTGAAFQPAPFYFTYRLTTTKEENAEGKWYGLVVTQEKPLFELTNGDKLYLLCRDERSILKSGVRKVATVAPDAVVRPGTAKSAGSSGEGFEEFPAAVDGDDDLPF